MSLISLVIWSCAKEEKGGVKDYNKLLETEVRSVIDCGPDPRQQGCTVENFYNEEVSTFMGCDAVVSYSVLVCKNNSNPPVVTSIAVYNLNIQYSNNCTTLTDSIFYYLANNNDTRAVYLMNMFNRLATQNVEAMVLEDELGGNTGLYQCGTSSLVNLDFFSSKCYKFCNVGKKQVFCGVGCCKRSSGYCYNGETLVKSVTNISQSAACQFESDQCENGGPCTTSACDIIIPVIIENNDK